MKIVKSSVFSVLAVVLSMSSLAQSFETNPASSASSSATPQLIPSVIYREVPAGNQQMDAVSAGAIPGFVDGAHRPSRPKFFRAEELGMTNSRGNMFMEGDHASFAVNASIPKINGMLSLVGTVYQARLDSTASRLVQVLSLVATRKMNAELAYSAKISRNSSLDSVISCNFHPDAGSGRADVAARIQYGIKF